MSPSDERSADVMREWSAKLLGGAFAAAVVAAVLLAVGALLPVVETGSPGFGSAPLLIVLAVAPVVLAGVFALRGRLAVSAGVLSGAGALAVGQILLDLQFLADASLTARPELYRPASLMFPGPGPGLWVLLAGHLAAVLAGMLAARAGRVEGDPAGPLGQSGGPRRLLLSTVVVGLVAGVGLVMAPFSSTDAFLPVGNAFERPPLVLAGCLLLACTLPLAGALAVSSGSLETASGSLLGLALGVLSVALPELVAGLAVPGAGATAGPYVAVAGAVALTGLAFLHPAGQDTTDPDADTGNEATEANLPGVRRLRIATGVLAMVTAVFAVIGSVAPQVVTASGADGPHSPARWLLLLAGLVVAVLGIATAVPATGGIVRPAVSTAWGVVPMAGTAVLDTAIAASELKAGLSAGSGVVWTSLAMFAAAATACCSVVAGMVERDDLEETEGGARPGRVVLIPLALGALLAVGALGLPAVTAPDYAGPGVFVNFATPSWGLLLGLLVVLGAAALAPRSRPGPAAALLAGAVCVVGFRVAELPFIGARVGGASAGLGWWFAVADVVVLLVAAVLAGRKAS
jgi:hypothetical protein